MASIEFRPAALLVAFSGAAGIGFLTGASAAVMALAKWSVAQAEAADASTLGARGAASPYAIFLRAVLSGVSGSLLGNVSPGKQLSSSGDHAAGEAPQPPAAPPRPAHCPLRPWADPRLDQSMYIRYDPPANRRTGAIVIVVPGGNYDNCDVNSGEGQPIAQWLVGMGITSVVLKYRLVSEGHYWPAQFEDWRECARQVVEQAPSWGCDPKRVGVIGFSAGGHLASFAASCAEAELRPALQILVYPSIDTETPRKSGDIDPWFPERGYPAPHTSSHHHVGPETPPSFLAGINGDTFCPADENTEVYAEALERHDVPFRYVTCEDHEHGCGLQDWWTEDCGRWLREQGWASRAGLSDERFGAVADRG
mmetsp:Transcript_23472/g.67248  ORF Transcript_23472/g.67248 Transcript_23472/m.67248 type:complete len:366 (+) Transcript_23472:71-1168(+)